MQKSVNEHKAAWLVSLVMLVCVTAGSLFYVLFGNAIIEAAYNGRSIELLNRLIADHRMSRPWGTLDHYFFLGRLLFSKLLFACILIELLLLGLSEHRYVRRTLNEFFTTAAHPINLAVFRIVLFFTMFTAVDIPFVTWLSELPAELRVAPIGVGWLLEHVPLNPEWARLSATLLLVCSFTAMIGLFSRTSALLTVILGVYVLGIPNFFAKVHHAHHHLLWFAAILAVSPCGDALSCDAVIAAWKRTDRGVPEPPGPSPAYALPLRLVLVLLGVIYFFSGFWKFWGSGLDWALSENLKFIMYQKWFDAGGWTPVFRIDRYPALYILAGVGTILFELSFIFLIFSRRLRLVPALGGLVFHTMTDLFMRISFKELLRCYAVFFDWNAMFRRVGRWIYKEELYVLYDGNCKLCRRVIASIRVFDVFGRATYVNALNQTAIKDHRLDWLNAAALLQDMYVVVGEKSWAGFPAYRVLAARIVFLWPLLPFLYLWPIPVIGRRIYRHVADSRICEIVHHQRHHPSDAGYRSAARSAAVAAIGIVLVVGNILAGIAQMETGWPFFVMYPTFSGIASPDTQSAEIVALDRSGAMIPLTVDTASRILFATNYWSQLSLIVSTIDREEGRERLRALGEVWKLNDTSLHNAVSIRLYRTTISTVPERSKENPIQRELLCEIKL